MSLCDSCNNTRGCDKCGWMEAPEPTKYKNYDIAEESSITITDSNGNQVTLEIIHSKDGTELVISLYDGATVLSLERKDLDRLGVAIMQFFCKNAHKSGG